MTESASFWDKKAESYAKSKIGDEATYQRKIAETQEFLLPTMRVAEFGCGTGSTAILHAPFVEHITAIDISANMLKIASDKAKEAGIENISFSCGTLEEFNAEAGSLDAVLGLNVLHLVPNRQAVIAEVARILKPGGIFVSSTVCMRNSPLRFIKLLVPLGKLLGQLPDVFVMSEEEFAGEVTAAGFQIERQWHHAKGGIAVFMVARKV